MDTQSLFPDYEPEREVSEKPIIGGILMIVGSLVGFNLAVYLFLSQSAEALEGARFSAYLMLGSLLTALILLGIGSMIGGVAAIRRKPYGLAVAGGVCSVFCSSFIGLVGLVLVIQSKREFVDCRSKNLEIVSSIRKRP
jgi:hypothetical protein